LKVWNHPKLCRTWHLCWLLLLATVTTVSGERLRSPEEVLGFPVGADRKLADWGQIAGYFRELSRDSDRILLEDLGETTEGRPLLMAVISDPANLGQLERYRRIQKRLADPRLLAAVPEA
jgi:hypothetical protein